MSNFLEWLTRPISILMQNYMQLDIWMKWALRIIVFGIGFVIISYGKYIYQSEKVIVDYKTKVEYRDTCIQKSNIFDNNKNSGVQSFNQKGGQTAREINNKIEKADKVHIGPAVSDD